MSFFIVSRPAEKNCERVDEEVGVFVDVGSSRERSHRFANQSELS